MKLPGVAVLALLAACSPDRPHPAAAPTTASSVAVPTCIPRASHHDDVPDGPATGHITGNQVTRAFAFTRDLTVALPPTGYRPAITEAQAECELRSAVSTGPVYEGRVALAKMTLRGAQVPAVPAYAGRVAWILVTDSTDTAPSCPATFNPSPSATTSPPPPDWPTPRGGAEEIVAIDATTGASALYYDEHYTCQGDPPAPTAGVPLQVQSLPWALASRSDRVLTLRAAWPACEAFAAHQSVGPPPGVDAMSLTKDERVSGIIAVRVWRPLGPQCGPDVSRTILVTPDLTGRPLPAALVHAPLGIEAA